MSTTTGPPSALIFIRTPIGLPPGLSCGFSAGAPSKEKRPLGPLTPKHGIRFTLGLSLRGRLRLKLAPGRRRDRTIRRAIGEALECVCNSRQLEVNLVGSVRPLQHDNPFPAEVKIGPEQQPNRDGYNRHEPVVTGDRDAPTRDS